jgi:hypothetical protein
MSVYSYSIIVQYRGDANNINSQKAPAIALYFTPLAYQIPTLPAFTPGVFYTQAIVAFG